MLARYSHSPSLHLVVIRSTIHRVLHGLLCILTAYSLYLLSQRGYPLLALVLSPLAIACCWTLARQGFIGTRISWQQGNWVVERSFGPKSVTIHHSSTWMPWIIYLAWVESTDARRSSVFLLPDSAPAEQLRGLRVRLLLER